MELEYKNSLEISHQTKINRLQYLIIFIAIIICAALVLGFGLFAIKSFTTTVSTTATTTTRTGASTTNTTLITAPPTITTTVGSTTTAAPTTTTTTAPITTNGEEEISNPIPKNIENGLTVEK